MENILGVEINEKAFDIIISEDDAEFYPTDEEVENYDTFSEYEMEYIYEV